ncbi:hypothetical protein K0N33_004189, partial [Salmonella enterica]|nr:hypothetical protein [Salmonella enterica]EFO5058665.1 hypothetical protein [Salmonella enterica subsp. enterica serovar Infantis]EJQ7548953.1 hypothetical protein [Salmonella enterica subsp. enterica]HCP2427236.1 hypothetical protein [Escherichia coli]HCS9174435.1 hypothetical protein [Salmonella enterica subsp. enterica serovar Cerro]
SDPNSSMYEEEDDG